MIDERQDTETMTGPDAGTLRDFLSILFKHKTKILAVFLSIVVTVTAVTFIMSPTYQAKSSVLVKFGRENLYRPEVGDKGAIISVGQPNQEEILNSEIEIITNRDLMDKVITTIGVEKLYPDLAGKTYKNGVTPKDVAIIQFGKKLSVEGVKKSNVITVSFQHKDPRMAAQVVNLLLDAFREKHLQVYSDPKSSFLEEQLADYRQKLQTSENTLQSFKQTQAVYALDDQRKLLLEQRMKLDTTSKETQNSVQELLERLVSLKAQTRAIAEDGNTFTYSEQGVAITNAKSKLLDLELKEHELLIKYKEDSPPVKDVRKEIQMTKEFLAAQEKDVASKVKTGNLVYQEAEKDRIRTEADLRAQQAKLASLGPQLAKVDAELKNLDRQEKQFQDLKRETATNERNYQTYQEKWEDARISDDMNKKKMANISIIQAATVPTEPIKPKKLLNIALSIVLGAVVALGAAFGSEYLGHTFNTAQDVERHLGLPVLTAVTGSRA